MSSRLGARVTTSMTKSRLGWLRFISGRGSFPFSSSASFSFATRHRVTQRKAVYAVDQQQSGPLFISSASPLLPSPCGLIVINAALMAVGAKQRRAARHITFRRSQVAPSRRSFPCSSREIRTPSRKRASLWSVHFFRHPCCLHEVPLPPTLKLCWMRQ